MPRACPVETHVWRYLAESVKPPRLKAVASIFLRDTRGVAASLKLHGTSPWSLDFKPVASSNVVLFQLLEFALRFDQDREVLVGVLPERKEILIRLARLGCVALHCSGARERKVCEWPQC